MDYKVGITESFSKTISETDVYMFAGDQEILSGSC